MRDKYEMFAIESDEESLKHYGVRGMRWGIRRNTKISSPEKLTDAKLARANRKGKVVISNDDKQAAKTSAQAVETLIRANAKVSARIMAAKNDEAAHNAAVGAMVASYIRTGTKPTKAYAKAYKATKDAKMRKSFEKRINKAEEFSRVLDQRITTKFGKTEVATAKKQIQDVVDKNRRPR